MPQSDSFGRVKKKLVKFIGDLDTFIVFHYAGHILDIPKQKVAQYIDTPTKRDEFLREFNDFWHKLSQAKTVRNTTLRFSDYFIIKVEEENIRIIKGTKLVQNPSPKLREGLSEICSILKLHLHSKLLLQTLSEAEKQFAGPELAYKALLSNLPVNDYQQMLLSIDKINGLITKLANAKRKFNGNAYQASLARFRQKIRYFGAGWLADDSGPDQIGQMASTLDKLKQYRDMNKGAIEELNVFSKRLGSIFEDIERIINLLVNIEFSIRSGYQSYIDDLISRRKQIEATKEKFLLDKEGKALRIKSNTLAINNISLKLTDEIQKTAPNGSAGLSLQEKLALMIKQLFLGLFQNTPPDDGAFELLDENYKRIEPTLSKLVRPELAQSLKSIDYHSLKKSLQELKDFGIKAIQPTFFDRILYFIDTIIFRCFNKQIPYFKPARTRCKLSDLHSKVCQLTTTSSEHERSLIPTFTRKPAYV